jgi:CBS domain-containing protein
MFLWLRARFGAPFWNLPRPAASESDLRKEAVMKVNECMTRDVRVIAADHTLQSAARIMADIDAGFLPVVDGDGLIGVLTDRDIAIRGVAAGKPVETNILDVMSEPIAYCFEDDDVGDVREHMGNMQIRRMPVLNHDMGLVGVVSISDCIGDGDRAQAGQMLADIVRPSGLHSQHL